VSCFTLGLADTFYGGEITEQSVMVVGLLPSPSMGVSSLHLAPLATAGRGLFHSAVLL
jgi:hypothetical protein